MIFIKSLQEIILSYTSIEEACDFINSNNLFYSYKNERIEKVSLKNIVKYIGSKNLQKHILKLPSFLKFHNWEFAPDNCETDQKITTWVIYKNYVTLLDIMINDLGFKLIENFNSSKGVCISFNYENSPFPDPFIVAIKMKHVNMINYLLSLNIPNCTYTPNQFNYIIDHCDEEFKNFQQEYYYCILQHLENKTEAKNLKLNELLIFAVAGDQKRFTNLWRLLYRKLVDDIPEVHPFGMTKNQQLNIFYGILMNLIVKSGNLHFVKWACFQFPCLDNHFNEFFNQKAKGKKYVTYNLLAEASTTEIYSYLFSIIKKHSSFHSKVLGSSETLVKKLYRKWKFNSIHKSNKR